MYELGVSSALAIPCYSHALAGTAHVALRPGMRGATHGKSNAANMGFRGVLFPGGSLVLFNISLRGLEVKG